MSTKACKIKLCECLGVAMDSMNAAHSQSHLRGTENGVMGMIGLITSDQEGEFGALLDDVVDGFDHSEKKGKRSLKTLNAWAVALCDSEI